MDVGIVSWGVYLPYWRLQRSAIGATLGTPSGRGTRAVASYDEDTTTMGAEAGRLALRGLDGDPPTDLVFSTPAPAYLDKTNATAIHAALGLPESTAAYDAVGSVRSAVGAIRTAERLAGAGGRAMAVLSDLRTGPAGSAEERDGGDGAVALVFGGGDGVAATLIGRASASEEFLDRWRPVGEAASRTWEERFGQEVYVPLVERAFAEALKAADLTADAVDHAAVAGLHARAVKAAVPALGVRSGVLADDHATRVGNLGAGQPAFLLADVLERAEPGQVIAVVVVADGADVLLWRTTDLLPAIRTARADAGVPTVADQVTAGRDDLPYARFLTWRGELRRDPPRRPDPERPGAPTMWRSAEWRGGFDASRCLACGFRHLPPTRVCLNCKAIDQMGLERLADVPARIATFTVDHLAFSLSPPVVGVVIDFDGGGRYRCQMTDVDPDALAIGDPVEMTFRRLYTADGVHNYFWKARPATGAASTPAAAGAAEGSPS
jgi:3-hydroxy-3-methylglutaryl CoA synthase/uncharacterized OB-fold protein